MGMAVDKLAKEFMQLPESEWQRLKALRDSDRPSEDAGDRELENTTLPNGPEATN